jgi:hypothetical protein
VRDAAATLKVVASAAALNLKVSLRRNKALAATRLVVARPSLPIA